MERSGWYGPVRGRQRSRRRLHPYPVERRDDPLADAGRHVRPAERAVEPRRDLAQVDHHPDLPDVARERSHGREQLQPLAVHVELRADCAEPDRVVRGRLREEREIVERRLLSVEHFLDHRDRVEVAERRTGPPVVGADPPRLPVADPVPLRDPRPAQAPRPVLHDLKVAGRSLAGREAGTVRTFSVHTNKARVERAGSDKQGSSTTAHRCQAVRSATCEPFDELVSGRRHQTRFPRAEEVGRYWTWASESPAITDFEEVLLTQDTRQLPFRAERALVNQLAEVAHSYGRSLNAELGLAVEAHINQARLALVTDPSARSDPRVKEMLERDPRLERRINETLAHLHRQAFDRNLPLGVLDGVGEAA